MQIIFWQRSETEVFSGGLLSQFKYYEDMNLFGEFLIKLLCFLIKAKDLDSVTD